MDHHSLATNSVPQLDACLKATGHCHYTADIRLKRMLYGGILRTNSPHARIARLDVSKAARLPGVKAVITAIANATGQAYQLADYAGNHAERA